VIAKQLKRTAALQHNAQAPQKKESDAKTEQAILTGGAITINDYKT
jgi:hypothetical protein